MKLVFVLPSMSRPDKFFQTVDNITENCLTEDYEIVAVLERSDATMNEGCVIVKILSYPKLKAYYTDCTGKVDAINKSLQFLPEDYSILILVADDIRFTMKGFDSFILEHMAKYFPDLTGCLHYPDNIAAAGERQITMPVLGRKLVEIWGYIYHNSYVSVYCDNEMLQVVKQLKKHKYIPEYFYTHNHPAWGKGENDDLYRRNEHPVVYKADGDNYFKRLALNFDL